MRPTRATHELFDALREALEEIPDESLPDFAGDLETLRVAVQLRVARPRVAAAAPESDSNGSGDLLSVEDAAATLGVSRSWMYSTRDIPRIKVGTHVRFSRRDLERYIARRRAR